jgi:hypothetical protein
MGRLQKTPKTRRNPAQMPFFGLLGVTFCTLKLALSALDFDL